MKKAVVLFISLLFISVLSILILKNLNDTDNYIKEQNSNFNKIQMIVLMNNLQTQISKIFLANQEMIENFLLQNETVTFPLQIKNSEIIFTINKYDRANINLLNKNDNDEINELLTIFNEYNIPYYDSLKDIYLREKLLYKSDEDSFIKNNKQIKYIINKVIKETYSDEILKIKDKIGFLTNSSNGNLYEIYVKIKHYDNLSKAYYILNKEGEVKYFESSFK